MGSICFKKTENMMASDQSPDPFSGLTQADKELIRKTWHKVTDKNSLAKVGLLFFIKLFTIYPYLQEYFQFFEERPISVLRSAKFRTHVIKFMYAITAYVENVDDPDVLESLMQKISEGHVRRKITYDDMQRLREIFLEFLQERLGKDGKPEVVYAWDKLFAASQQVYAATLTRKTAGNI